jgi:RimJ/RimL family protein N-acetyltransferase
MIKENLFLIPLEQEHIEIIRGWRNDKDIKKSFFSYDLINKVQQQNWFEQYCKDNKQLIFAIIDNYNESFIGTIGFNAIDHFNQRAELGTLIGNKEYWGKGYASEALFKLLEYSFNEMNLNRVYSYIIEFNVGSIKKNEKLGFKIEGKLRNHTYKNGKFQDVVIMGILKDEFINKNLLENEANHESI